MTPGRLEWTAALTAGLALRLVAARNHAWWGDEAFVLEIARLPLPEAWAAVRPDLHPPLFPLLCKLWTALLGLGPVLSRGPALLAGVAMHAAAASLAGLVAPPHRRVWSARAGLWVGVAWGFLLVPGVELRHYGPAAAAAGLALVGLLRALAEEEAGRGPRLALGAGLVLLVHLQAQGWLLLGAAGLVAALHRRKDVLMVVVVAALLGAPQLADSASKFLAFSKGAPPTLGPKRLAGPVIQLTAGFRVANTTPAKLLADTGALGWLACVGAALLVALGGLVRLLRRRPVQVVAGVLGVVAGGVALLAPGGYQARYLALLGPPGLALVITGLAASPAPRTGLALLLVANLWAGASVARAPVNPVHREDSRAALRWLSEGPPGTRPALVMFGAGELVALEGRAAWAAEHPGLTLDGVAAHDPTEVAAAAVQGAPPAVRIAASRQEYLDPGVAAALVEAMEARGYELVGQERFGDHLPAWEYRRRSDSS